MRGAARGLTAALALLLVAATAGAPGRAAAAPARDDPYRPLRALDGLQFLEDEPAWVCVADPPVRRLRILGIETSGRPVRLEFGPAEGQPLGGGGRAGAVDLFALAGAPGRAELHPLGPEGGAGLSAGRYELRPAGTDSARAIARFTVLRPRGSELAVRSALARARRLAESPEPARRADAARLYEAVLARYPRTSYRTTVYANLWQLREWSTVYGREPDTFLEEMFAHFHDSCFGVWGLDHFVEARRGEDVAPLLRRLLGLYPDTRLSRAAARHL